MMCKMLCSDATLIGEELLEDSIKNLERMDFIIFQDDFENGLIKLTSVLNLKIPQNPKLVYNQTKNSKKKETLSDEEIQKIREMNDLDIRLYEYADKNLRKKFQKL